MTLTDIDFKFLLKAYKCDYEILECYYSLYKYLPEMYVDFVLEKYENKTKLKNVEGKEIEYAIEKANFNSLYGMSVTNTIRDEVIFENEINSSFTVLYITEGISCFIAISCISSDAFPTISL